MIVLGIEIRWVGVDCEWKRLASLGPEYKIKAIKEYRDSFLRKGKPIPGLFESKVLVENYMANH